MSQYFSGLPFGPSIYCLFVLALFPVGLGVSFFPKARKYGIGFLLLGAVLIGMEIFGPEIEYNPTVASQELTGTWRDGADRLTLREDGTYVFSRDGVEHSGTWENDDWNLNLSPGLSNLSFYPRVIRVGSELRIPTNFQHIDLWDGDFGLSR